jgi:integrase/recombinase XerC
MLGRFIQYLSSEKRYSNHTVVNYKSDLQQFLFFIQNEFDVSAIEDANPEMIRSWFVSLLENRVSPRSVNRKKTTLKSFYKYAIKVGKITENPILKVLSPKTAKRLPEFIDEDKMLFLLNQFDFENENDFLRIRDRLIMEMFYATGMRLSELINLKTSDVSLSENSVKVLGKRNKERIIPFGSNLKKLIQDYLTQKILYVKEIKYDDWFFVTEKNKKLYSKLVYRLVYYYISAVATNHKKSPHVLRHTFATHMLNHGADLNTIKEILGHANLAATQVYTHNSIEKLKSLYKQAHPKA